jgi:hypothetical protein
MLPESLYRNSSPGSLNIYSINQLWFQGGSVEKDLERRITRIREIGTTAYGARAKCWIPVELQSESWYFSGLIRLSYRSKPINGEKYGKLIPVFLVQRLKLEDVGCSYSDFSKFFMCKSPALLNYDQENWKEIERLVLLKIQQQSKVSPENAPEIWIRGDSEEGIRLALELRDWKLMYQSFLNRRANKMRGILHVPGD